MFIFFRHKLNVFGATRRSSLINQFSFMLGRCLPGYSVPLQLFSKSTICHFPTSSIASLLQPYRYFSSDSKKTMANKTEKITVDKQTLRNRLTPVQYEVTQEAATERPFTGIYNDHYEKGVYQCIVCHQDLFSSNTKFDSSCGWPAFNDVLDEGKVTLHRDDSIPHMIRTEVRCSKCSAHMGHVFDDGPAPKYLRYCINSASLDFVAKK